MTRLLRRAAALVVCAACVAPHGASAQERGAVALGEAVAGLDVTARVLVIGAHPDDEDTQLITWLARGRQVETAYLSLTRGDGGQNLIGNELGPMLGMIRTEELLAARRLDGGRQYFTRAYDFGFSKSAEETYTHWVKDSILRDMVTVVRAFRPQVIVAVFSGTPRDGHGHHQVSGLLAREVFDAAADTVRFPARSTLAFGAWTPSKFYRAARFNPTEATVSFNVGELSALRGRTYAEIASESRSQHLSQGFGALQRRGTSMDYLKLEVSRLPGGVAVKEQSPLDGIPAGFLRFDGLVVADSVRAALDSLPKAIEDVRRVEDLVAPAQMAAPLGRVLKLAQRVRRSGLCDDAFAEGDLLAGTCGEARGDLITTVQTTIDRATVAFLAAAGVQLEATAGRELLAVGDTMTAIITLYNQGPHSVALGSPFVLRRESGSMYLSPGPGREGIYIGPPRPPHASFVALPDSAGRSSIALRASAPSIAWWLAQGRMGDMFMLPAAAADSQHIRDLSDRNVLLGAYTREMAVGEDHLFDTGARASVSIGGAGVLVDIGPVVYRFADPARGERVRPVAAVPAVSVLLDDEVQFARADVPFDRVYRVHLKSAASTARGASVTLALPAGLRADSAVRRAALEPFGGATVSFRVRGTLAAGRHTIGATVTSNGETFASGYLPITYEHIRPLRYYRPATVQIEAVHAALPRNTRVAYIPGVGDNAEPMLAQLGLAVTLIPADQLASADLTRYGSVVVGPRAFAASSALISSAGRLQQFARNGGTVVVQYGQGEMQTPGVLPYPITLARTAQRVTDERAPITVLDPRSRLLASPNRITSADFEGWVQERSLYMPATADPHYITLLEMHDPGEPENRNAVLVAPLGKGAYVYTTLALFRQLPAGVPGAARLFLNFLAADGQTSAKAPLTP